jgi:hypothetical protein
MAINPNTNATMSGRVTSPTLDYPYGSSKNESAPGAGDGTPYFLARADDIFGFQQWLLAQASIVPSGDADNARISDYGDALSFLLDNARAGRKNLLIGNFFVNQRGVSGAVVLSAGDYGHDRFKAGSSGCTYTFATTNGVTTATIASGSLVQVVESINIAPGGYILSHVGTSQVQINGGGFGNSGAVTATLDGSANATIEYSTGTLSLPQLERGTVATSFDRRKFGDELAMCFRYTIVFQSSTVEKIVGSGWRRASNTLEFLFPVPVELRVSPSVTTSGLVFSAKYDGNSTDVTGALSVGGASASGVRVNGTVTGLSGNYPVAVTVDNSGFLIFDSEL